MDSGAASLIYHAYNFLEPSLEDTVAIMHGKTDQKWQMQSDKENEMLRTYPREGKIDEKLTALTRRQPLV